MDEPVSWLHVCALCITIPLIVVIEMARQVWMQLKQFVPKKDTERQSKKDDA